MNFFKTCILTCSISFTAYSIKAQEMPQLSKTTSMQINNVFNVITNDYAIRNSFQQLKELKQGQRKKFTIVHIGDSHLQCGFFTALTRKKMQTFFGNAGRGVIFPYQLAKSDAPTDLKCNSNLIWSYNRLAHPEINKLSGIAGFIVQNNNRNASFNVNLNCDSESLNTQFNKITLFADMPVTDKWKIGNVEESYSINKNSFNSHDAATFNFSKPTQQFTLETDSTDNTKTIYGFLLENGKPGLLYHTLAVNGAQYEQYNMHSNFWKQLPELDADMYIFSLGTNEAQKSFFDPVRFGQILDSFLINIKTISPRASIVITTVADNYKNGKPGNNEIKALNNFLVSYCDSKGIAYWDMYRTTNGYGSARRWNEAGMMSRDKIHFTAGGYEFQASLFYDAFSKSYNEFLKKH